MKKSEILQHLKDAKEAHVGWVNNAKFLIKGVNLDESAIPVNATDCKFGKWFYAEMDILKKLPNAPISIIEDIEKLHKELHDKYLEIFKIYFSEDKKVGFLSKLLGKKRKEPSSEEKEKALQYFKELEDISNRLITKLSKLETAINSIPQEDL